MKKVKKFLATVILSSTITVPIGAQNSFRKSPKFEHAVNLIVEKSDRSKFSRFIFTEFLDVIRDLIEHGVKQSTINVKNPAASICELLEITPEDLEKYFDSTSNPQNLIEEFFEAIDGAFEKMNSNINF